MKNDTKRYGFASALAGAYLFFGGLGVCVVSAEGKAHPKEKIGGYTTYFNEKEGGRCANIRLAAARLDGIALQPYGVLSFNGAVGPRTEKNGYQKAKVIAQGEFVEGVGGGVCQVSTTLYNAALLSGLEIEEYHPHSLRIWYVPLSRDAMVTAWCDLRLYNPYSETVYLSVRVGTGSLQVAFYGKPSGKRYEIESKQLEEIPPPEPTVIAGDKDETVKEGRCGVRSESYLKTYENGVLIGVKRLRTDTYAPQRGVIRKKT